MSSLARYSMYLKTSSIFAIVIVMNVMRQKSLGKEILKALGTGVALYIALGSPIGTRRLLYGIKREWKKKLALQALDRLQRKELIDYRFKKNGEMRVVLTDAGKEKVRQFYFDELAPLKPKRWDKKWRVILSDIPERHKKARDALRHKYQEWGFYLLQKSVYVYPYSCEEEIAIIRDIFHIPTVSLFIIETDFIGDQQKLKKHFSL
jgi:CRISPR/Cas system-associated endoribonuclease Cas2